MNLKSLSRLNYFRRLWMKRIYLLFFCFSLVSFISPPLSGEGPSGMNSGLGIYTNEDFGFKIKYSLDWVVKTTERYIFFVVAKESRAVITIGKSPTTAKSIDELNIQEMKPFGKKSKITAAGLEAI